VLHHPCGQVLGLQWRCSHCGGGLERTGLAFSDQGTSPDLTLRQPEREH
jgi:hypothetical protein